MACIIPFDTGVAMLMSMGFGVFIGLVIGRALG